MNGYTDTIRKWAANDSHAGILGKPDGTGEVGLEAGEAGRTLAVRFTLQRKGDRVEKVRYQVFGCGFTIAACAAAAELAEGSSLEKARAIDARQIDRTLDGLPADRGYCADIASKALQAAVSSLESAGAPIRSDHHEEEHGARIKATDTVYRLLMSSPNRKAAPHEDRRLFAGVITLAAAEPYDLTRALGLDRAQLTRLLDYFFPTVFLDNLLYLSAHATALTPEVNGDVQAILRSHVPADANGRPLETSSWLAAILAARAAHPGHLWVAMGLFERPELTAAIRRHLPTLAEANSQNMRWKRYFFKTVCDLNGGTMCKSPNCGACSDYALCFAPEGE